MKKVYVPLDGSERAEAALGAAVPLATRLGAELVLLSARRPDVGIGTTRTYLDARAASLDRPARSLLVLDRDPAAAIALAANEQDAVVCMATRGRGAFRQAVLGSVAEEVVRASTTPLVLVGPRFQSTWELGETPIVLAGLDGSDPSRAAAFAAGGLALEMRARVRVVEVLRPSDVITVGEFPTTDVELLEEVVGQLEASGVAAEHRDDRRVRSGRRTRAGCRRAARGIHRGREPWALRPRSHCARERLDAHGEPGVVPRARCRAQVVGTPPRPRESRSEGCDSMKTIGLSKLRHVG